MNERIKSVQDLLCEAIAIENVHERASYLARACGADGALRQEVEELLEAQAQAGQFLPENPATADRGAFCVDGDLPTSAGSALVIPVTEKPGDRIGRYKLLQKIGEGGCGVVYMAEQEEPIHRKVALKVIKLGMDTKQVVARFDAERQALALMDHPNIAKVFDGGATETGRPYFVMELVRGIRITDYCDQHQLSTVERLDLFIEVCQAVQHAHQKGIIHRDLKPSNILVTVNDGMAVPKVIDFGIAKATGGRLTDQTLFTAFEQFLGTPAYMSPEQAEMTSVDIDTRSDIYSLGVLLYELLTGKTPFDTKTLLAAGLDEMRRTIREKEPLRPSTALRGMRANELTTTAKRRREEPPRLIHLVRGDLDWIVMKCLEKERARRYETANGLARDIQRHLDSEPVVARPASRLYRFRKLAKRNKIVFAAAGAVATVLVAGLVVSTAMFLKEKEARQEADRAQQAESRQRDEALRSSNAARAAQAQAEQERERARELSYASDMHVAWVALRENNLAEVTLLLEAQIPRGTDHDLRDWEWRYPWQACRGDQLWTLRPVEGKAGQQDGIFSAGASAEPEAIVAIGLLPSNRLVTGSMMPNGRIRIWDLESRRPLRASKLVENVSGLAVSPDGHQLAVAGWDREVRLLDATTLELTGKLLHTNPVWSVVYSPNGKFLATHGSEDVSVWDLAGGRMLWATNVPRGSMSAPGFSPDSSWLVCQIGHRLEGPVAFLRTQDGPVIRIRDGTVEDFSSPEVVSGDGRWVAAANWDGIVGVANPELTQFKLLTNHHAAVRALAFSPDGRQLATAGLDRLVKLWDVESGKETATFAGHQNGIESLAYPTDGQRLFTGAKDGTIRAWPTKPKPAAPGLPISAQFFYQTLSRDGRFLAGFETNGVCHVFNVETLHEVGSLKMEQPFECQSLGNDGKEIAFGNADGTVQVWDLQQGRLSWSFSAHTNRVDALTFSSDGGLLATAGQGARICVWEQENSHPILERVLGGQDYHVNDMVFATDNATLVLPAYGKIHLISLKPGGQDKQTAIEEAFSIDISNDGSLVAAGLHEEVRVWETSSLRLVSRLRGSLAAFHSVSFSPNGRRVAAADNRGVTWVWDLATDREVARFEYTLGRAHFQPDGNTLVILNFYTANLGPLEILRAPSLADIQTAERLQAAAR